MLRCCCEQANPPKPDSRPHTNRVEQLVPAAGNVRLLFFTDEQWAKSVTVMGPNYNQGRHAIDPKVPNQVEFWD